MSALKRNATVDVYLYISKVYVKLDQPLNSIGKLKEGNEKFPFEPSLLQAIARIYEVGYLQSLFSWVFLGIGFGIGCLPNSNTNTQILSYLNT